MSKDIKKICYEIVLKNTCIVEVNFTSLIRMSRTVYVRTCVLVSACRERLWLNVARCKELTGCGWSSERESACAFLAIQLGSCNGGNYNIQYNHEPSLLVCSICVLLLTCVRAYVAKHLYITLLHLIYHWP